MNFGKLRKAFLLVSGHGLLFASGGCLPDNIFADTAGDIVNSLILNGFNMLLAGTGVQI